MKSLQDQEAFCLLLPVQAFTVPSLILSFNQIVPNIVIIIEVRLGAFSSQSIFSDNKIFKA